jgi:hypothetical protein
MMSEIEKGYVSAMPIDKRGDAQPPPSGAARACDFQHRNFPGDVAESNGVAASHVACIAGNARNGCTVKIELANARSCVCGMARAG